MDLTLESYQNLSMGLTQRSDDFREALNNLSYPSSFYSGQVAAKNRLNHALIGHNLDLDRPVNIVGLIDYPTNRLVMSRWGEVKEYNLDDIDSRYMSKINQTEILRGRKPKQLPLTDVAVSILNDETSSLPNVPDAEIIDDMTSSRQILQRAFANEMVFQVALEEYIKDNDLDVAYSKHSDELTELVSTKAYEASFNDGLKDLGKEVQKMTIVDDMDR